MERISSTPFRWLLATRPGARKVRIIAGKFGSVYIFSGRNIRKAYARGGRVEAYVSKLRVCLAGGAEQRSQCTEWLRRSVKLVMVSLMFYSAFPGVPASAQSARTFVEPRLIPATLDPDLGPSESLVWAGRVWHFPKESLMNGALHPPPVIQFEWREGHFAKCCTTHEGLVRIFLSQDPLLPVTKTVMYSAPNVRIDNAEISGFRFLSSMREMGGSYSQYFVPDAAGSDSRVTLMCADTLSSSIKSSPGQCELSYMQFADVSVLIRSQFLDRTRLPLLYRDLVDFLDRASR